MNEQIRIPTVHLIDEQEKQVGVVSLEEAKKLAQEKGFDLVEVAPNVQPPVCKLMDYGKFLYHQKKIEQKHRKMQKKTEVKGIRLSFRTNQHDVETKIRHARKFLENRDVVKVSLIFKGREAAHMDLARNKLEEFAQLLTDICHVEQPPKRQGNTLMMILAPMR